MVIDLRGHGDSHINNDADLATETLVNNVIAVVKAMYPDDDQYPGLNMIGHSMGGAVCVQVVDKGSCQYYRASCRAPQLRRWPACSLSYFPARLTQRKSSTHLRGTCAAVR